MPMRFALSLAACSLAAVALAACGSSGSSEDEGQITDAINAAAVSGEASACTDAETQAFVEQSNYETGAAAVTECKKNAGESNADSVDVTGIEVDGDTATAGVAVTGSSFDGQTLAVSLVKEDGAWKLDRFEDFVSFDQQKFADAFTSEADQQGQLTSKQVQCISSNIESADPSAVKQAILSGDGTAVSSLLFAGC